VKSYPADYKQEVEKFARQMSRNSLIAVVEESGSSSRPGPKPDDDFALAALIIGGRRAYRQIVKTDMAIQVATNRSDYKYRQVRQCTEARTRIADLFTHQSSLIRVFCYYASGGAYSAQTQRELEAARGFGLDETEAIHNCDLMAKNPGLEGLKDALRTSVAALGTWGSSRQQHVEVYFDQRTDLKLVESEIVQSASISELLSKLDGSPFAMTWKGECPTAMSAVQRIADTIAGDARATFKKHGAKFWGLVRQHGFVRRHQEALRLPGLVASHGVPVPFVGSVPHFDWESDWMTASIDSTLFPAYRPWLINHMCSLYSPCGRGLLLKDDGREFAVHQAMD
jgi:hypothetical protein